MSRKHTPSFILELPLRTTRADERECAIVLDAARNVGNAILGEGLRRLDRMRQSKAYQAARKMPHGAPRSAERKARATEFKRLFEAFGVTPHSLQKLAQACRDGCWIKDHLPGHIAQTAATRALNAILAYAFGKRGRPRFKRRDRYDSIEGKEAKSTIIWRNGSVRFTGLVIPAILDPTNPWQVTALKADTKYCRIIRRRIRGWDRWYVQLVQEGLTPLVHETKPGVICMDIGPSTIAVVGQTEAIFEKFCPTVVEPWRETRRLQRAMDRSRRATNPDCFDEKGRWKKGAKARNRSRRYQALAARRRDRDRRLAAERRRAHGELGNRILGQGTTGKAEKLSYRSFQKNFGKSSKVRGAGMFVGIMRNKFKAAAGSFDEFSTRTTCLSQFDHVDGTYTKKPLKQRYHQFSDGSRVQRDLYSAFLGRFVSENRLDAKQAAQAWTGAEAFLRAAADGIEPASGRGFAIPHVLPHMQRVRAGRSVNGAGNTREAGDAVTAAYAAARVPESGAAGAEAHATAAQPAWRG
jgi:putative transposase